MKTKLLFGLLILGLFLISGCEGNGYSSSEEAFEKSEYSGNIEDLNFCSIQIASEKQSLWFTFIGLEDIEECKNIKKDCESNDNNNQCHWIVSESSISNGNSGIWRAKYTGHCLCDLR